jgi:hypothetical protein
MGGGVVTRGYNSRGGGGVVISGDMIVQKGQDVLVYVVQRRKTGSTGWKW